MPWLVFDSKKRKQKDMYTIGIDPDSDRHGVAIYWNARLVGLENYTLMQIQSEILQALHDELLFSIEDVCSQSFIYSRNAQKSKAAHAKVARNVGLCQQAQVELVRMLDYYGIPYELHKPSKGNWAKNKKQFEKCTGWQGKSNEDTRSASYWGFLALK